jgi:hypothetical protein
MEQDVYRALVRVRNLQIRNRGFLKDFSTTSTLRGDGGSKIGKYPQIRPTESSK